MDSISSFSPGDSQNFTSVYPGHQRLRRLEVVGAANKGARDRDTRVSLARPVLSSTQYFQVPATQATKDLTVHCPLFFFRKIVETDTMAPEVRNKEKISGTLGRRVFRVFNSELTATGGHLGFKRTEEAGVGVHSRGGWGSQEKQPPSKPSPATYVDLMLTLRLY